MNTNRPATHKPRGVCRYYNVPRGCFAGDKCKFLHGEPPVDPTPEAPPLLTPYDKAKRCRYYAQGFCKRGDSCWFLHVADPSPSAPLEEEDEACSICFEKPSTYALLSGCNHIFCTTCIKQWRDPQNRPGGISDSGNTKKCPMCRTPSKFITPSSRFWKHGTPEKEAVVQAYKDSMAKVPCRYFQKSIQKNKDRPLCPYGKDCFYQHLKEDGTPYIFKDGVDICMRRYRQAQLHRRGLSFADMHFMPLSLADLDFMLPVTDRPPRENGPQINGIPSIRSLQDVGRSIEVLNDFLGDFTSVDDLEVVAGARNALLRQGPGASRRRGRNAAARREEDFRDFLTEQVLASISRYRAATHRRRDTPTPPPPLEPVDLPEGWGPLLDAHRRAQEGINDAASDSGSMPVLYSVSASEDEGNWSDDDDDSDDGDDSQRERAMLEHYSRYMRRRGDAEMPTSAPAAGPSEAAEETDDGPPPLEPIDASDEEEGSEDAPFVTDGRGRAVWTGPGEENKRDRSSERDGEDGGGQAGGSGRSFLGWFNALF